MKKLFNKELIIGISVILAIVILFFGIEYLKGINMFSPANFYYVNCANVSGLEISSPVMIDGYKVGQVREISYDYDNPGKIKVLLAVNKKLRVPDDSYAVLASTLMGGGYIGNTGPHGCTFQRHNAGSKYDTSQNRLVALQPQHTRCGSCAHTIHQTS